MKTHTFKKSERLCSRKQIEYLLNNGCNIKEDVFSCKYIKKSDGNRNNSTQLLISVPKRNVKSAVNRNRIKRLIRESYRKNKSLINDKVALILLVYYSSQIPDYSTVENLLLKIIEQLLSNIEQS